MKAVLDTMLWVSYCTRRHGSRHRLIERAFKGKVRLFVSDYILDEFEPEQVILFGSQARGSPPELSAVHRSHCTPGPSISQNPSVRSSFHCWIVLIGKRCQSRRHTPYLAPWSVW